MKKYIVILLISAGVAISCQKQLDLPSDGRISLNEVFNNYDRTRGYLNSCYGYCPAPYMDRSSFTDESQDADDISAGSRYSAWYVGGITSQNYP